MTQHILLFDNTIYTLRRTAAGLVQWDGVLGPLGALFTSEAEALNWIELMLKYEYKGRGQIFVRCTADKTGDV